VIFNKYEFLLEWKNSQISLSKKFLAYLMAAVGAVGLLFLLSISIWLWNEHLQYQRMSLQHAIDVKAQELSGVKRQLQVPNTELNFLIVNDANWLSVLVTQHLTSELTKHNLMWDYSTWTELEAKQSLRLEVRFVILPNQMGLLLELLMNVPFVFQFQELEWLLNKETGHVSVKVKLLLLNFISDSNRAML
jgi:hypothetical protein